MKTVTVQIPDDYANILSQWASVSRTLKQAIRLLDIDNHLTQYEDVNNCIQELVDLEPAIDSLHQIVRSKLWEQGN